MQNNLLVGNFFINDFHRANSMAAQREVQRMSLHPYSREQMLRQISTQTVNSFKKEYELAKKQENNIELWARATDCWTENIDVALSTGIR